MFLRARQPEVADFRLPRFVDEHVCGLDVAVDDVRAQRVQVHEASGNIAQHAPLARDGQLRLCCRGCARGCGCRACCGSRFAFLAFTATCSRPLRASEQHIQAAALAVLGDVSGRRVCFARLDFGQQAHHIGVRELLQPRELFVERGNQNGALLGNARLHQITRSTIQEEKKQTSLSSSMTTCRPFHARSHATLKPPLPSAFSPPATGSSARSSTSATDSAATCLASA